MPNLPVPTPDRIHGLLAAMEHGLLERGAAVRLALLAALAGEHILLIGPPGTAKSALARRLQHAFADARYFERLLTRFSVPEELFGPLSLKALEHDRYERLTDGYLPTAGIAFLDEVFKANSAILNALLTLLNEREFDNGTERLHTPLICVVGATNEVPQDESLQAFHDRFLLRVPVASVGDEAFDALLDLDLGADLNAAAAEPLTRDAVVAIQAAREDVVLATPARAALHALRAHVATQGIRVSDRRWRQLVQLLRMQAATRGSACVEALDLWLVPYAVSDRPEQVEPLQAWWLDTVLEAPPVEAPWLLRAVEAFEKQLDLETRMQQEEGDAGKIALARSIGQTMEERGMARLVSERLEARMRRHYSPVHVQARIAQLDEALGPLAGRLDALALRADAVETAAQRHLWLPPTLARALVQRWRAALTLLQGLHARLEATRAGFASLPIDEALAAETPEPVRIDAAA